MKSRPLILIGLLFLMQLFSLPVQADPAIDNTASYLRELRRSDSRFVKDIFGTITDKKTGLQWYCGYFMRRKDWHQVNDWAKNLTVGGGGWRLAKMDELAALYPAAAKSGLFRVDWSYSAVITTSSAAADESKNPSYKDYHVSTKWWLKKGMIPSHYGKKPVAGSLSFIDGSALPNLCGEPGTGPRVRVSMAVRRALR